jgi:putative transcriptional regulator
MFKDQTAESNSSTGEAATMTPGSSEGTLDFSNPSTPSQVETEQRSLPYNDNMYKIPSRTEVKYIDNPQRRITEIRIFFDDQTWETFVPKK